MRVPIRKGTGPVPPLQDPKMTIEKYEELKKKLDFWLNTKRPKEALEVRRLAEMGDFSENTGYQIAKGRLRGLNQRILDLQQLLAKVEIIDTKNISNVVQIGNQVEVEIEGKIKNYKILGSAESDPNLGIISHSSPLGSFLLNKKLGEDASLTINGKNKLYKILKIF